MRRFTKLAKVIGATAFGAVVVAAPASAHEMSGDELAPGLSHHMTMTEKRPTTPADLQRARLILSTLRRAIGKYRDYRLALAEGDRIFLPTVPQEVYHFMNFPNSTREYRGHFDPARPGSLLYVKEGSRKFRLVGAMYSAPPNFTPQRLDALVPLSVARWHVHTNICLPNGFTIDDVVQGNIGAGRNSVPGMLSVSTNPMAASINQRLGFFADGRFGFRGKIFERGACESARGHFESRVFGWMVHVYPFAGDDLKVAFGSEIP